ncbi:MAG: cphA, partial [Alphaproteobacteria bacterium]|nr:cphA [Alphaproteobacteria bacterium]
MSQMFFGAQSDSATKLLTQQMNVIETGVYRGPHYYSHTPMIRVQVDLGRIEEWPTQKLPGFTDALLALLPGLENHGCCHRTPGGFVRRLREGTWIGHVAEHVALELQTIAGHRVTRGKTRSVKRKPGIYNVMFAYAEEQVGLMAGRIALELVNSLLPESLGGIDGLDRICSLEGE